MVAEDICAPDGDSAGNWGEEWHGETKLWWARPKALFSTGLLYPKLHIEDNRGCEIMQSQQSLILFKNQGFFPANLSYTNGLADLHHLLARRPINILWLLTKVCQSIRLIFSKSNYFKVWRHPPKVLDKVAFLQGRGAVGLQQRKEFITLRV